MNNSFYVYAHLLPDGTPFYIGKGSGNRRHSTQGRSDFWWGVVRKHYGDEKPPTTLLESGLDESTSLQREVHWISTLGRRSIGAGQLVNLTEGGDGASHPHSEETKKKLRQMKLGVKFTPEHKLALSESAKRRAKENPELYADKVERMLRKRSTYSSVVLHNVNTNVVVEVKNVLRFCNENGLRQDRMSDVICGRRKSHGGWVLTLKRT